MPSIADLLRREIKHSGETLSAIARATGVLQPPLWRFCNGQPNLKLEWVESLLDYFGYVVVKRDGQANRTANRPARPTTAKARTKSRTRRKP
jgi:hypothetical protein